MSSGRARPPKRAVALCLLALALPAGGGAIAQDRDAAAPPQRDGDLVACEGQIITSVRIAPQAAFEPSRSPIIAKTGEIASRLHENTRPDIIRRYLALSAGDRCYEVRRAESERILRAQPFISDATVVAYKDGDGVRLSVTVVDEVSLIVGGSLSTGSPHIRSIKLGEGNLRGNAMYVAGRWENGGAFRDGWSARITDYQFLGRPYQLTGEWGRRPVGDDWRVEASHSYLTDLQRFAWRTSIGEVDTHVHFRREDADRVSLGVKHEFADAGAVMRVGSIGRLTLVGGSLSRETHTPAAGPVMLRDGLIVPDTSTVLIGRYSEQRQARVNAMLGVRALSFMEVTGFDALDATQDVRKGLQLGFLLGRGVKFLDSKSDEDFFAAAGAYAGIGSPSAFAAMEVNVEGKRQGSEDSWNSVLSSGRFAFFAKPFTRHTGAVSLEWSGGWRSRVPYQLTFAAPDGGLRGYRKSDVGGARRMVVRMEDRYVWGRFRKRATVGVAAFVDAGKLWAGDAPYGVDTPIRYSVGLSLLAAIPPRTRRLARIDLAVPLNSPDGRKIEVRIAMRDFARTFWKEPGDLRQARERSLPSSVFNWP